MKIKVQISREEAFNIITQQFIAEFGFPVEVEEGSMYVSEFSEQEFIHFTIKSISKEKPSTQTEPPDAIEPSPSITDDDIPF